jgi:UDP-GlcNAc:undecaprenyl-phosphate/decaprenyl-phosphate GlcNAc-1-phosphate transferase
MNVEFAPVLGAGVAAVAASVATPLAIRLARHVDFYDMPREYRQHRAPTPLLGGAAVIGAFIAAAIAVGASGRLVVLVVCAVGLWVVGTIDDLIAVAPVWRLLTETGVALTLVAVGLGWSMYGQAGDIALTVLWIIGLVNGFNLMDNLDGACASVACASAAGIGTLAALNGDFTAAGLALALAASCAVFLHWNLAGPARIFLGDGGSRPIGLLIAGLAIVAVRHIHAGHAQVVVGALMAGVVILDTALVSVSRTRRGVTLVTGGRDHLSHRLLPVLRTPRGVAAALAVSQAALCVLGIIGGRSSSVVLAILALITVTAGLAAIGVLDSQRWRPPGIAVGASRGVPQTAESGPVAPFAAERR